MFKYDFIVCQSWVQTDVLGEYFLRSLNIILDHDFGQAELFNFLPPLHCAPLAHSRIPRQIPDQNGKHDLLGAPGGAIPGPSSASLTP